MPFVSEAILKFERIQKEKPIKNSFVLGVDLDGVCGDHNLIFRNMLQKNGGGTRVADPQSKLGL